jgi:hypothetical protein
MNMTRFSLARVGVALGVLASVPLFAQSVETKAGAPRLPAAITDYHAPPQGFSVVLVLGDLAGSSVKEDSVPAAARKALTDLKDFLPYKSYRLLDSQFSACCGSPAIISRLRGPDEQEYELELTPRAMLAGKWSVRFALREPGGGASAGDYSGALRDKEGVLLSAQRNEIERQLADLRQKLDERHPDVLKLKAQIQDLERRADAMRLTESTRKVAAAAGAPRESARAVIDTSFTMDVGETVVVGTSRLKGDKALIALLTAIAPRK